MGLDTTHNCWHGSYGAFKAFREAIAEVAKKEFDYEPDYDAHPMRSFQGWWDPQDTSFIRHNQDLGFEHHGYSHPLDVFFIHSDFDGYIFPRDAADLLPFLTQILLRMVQSTDTDSGWIPHLAQFIEGLQAAVDNWEIVEFH